MLRRRRDEDLAVLARLRPTRVRLEVEVLLAADLDLAREALLALRQSVVTVSATNDVRLRVKASRFDRVADANHGGKRLVLDLHLRGGETTRFIGGPDDDRDDMAFEGDLASDSGEERFVVANGADVVHTGNVFRGQHH